MNDLSDQFTQNHRHCYTVNPIPVLALYILITLFFIGLSVSIFILIVVHNPFCFLSLVLLFALVLAFVVWNTVNWRRNGALLVYLRSFPESDLRVAREGQLVKITGPVSCGNVSLESSYEKATRCIYASTLLYEYRGFGINACWNLAYCERFSTDFYITDRKSDIRAVVKAGSDCKVIPLIFESRLVNATGQSQILSSHLRKWLTDRNLSSEARQLRLEEGYVKEGSNATVIGMLHRNNGILMIVQPPEVISTGCLWRKLLLPVDIDGLIIGCP